MNTYAFICTREKGPTVTRNNLTHYLSRAGVQVKLLVGQDSIFSGYKKAFELTNPNPTDTIILCHDDIEILSDIKIFINALETHLSQYKAGFVGVAGTTHLDKDAVWWDHTRWKAGLHRGHVFHGKSNYEYDNTYYGPPDQVVVMDGLFLAAKAKTLNENSDDNEVFNVMGQLQSLQRIKRSGELENNTEKKEQLTQHGMPRP